MDRTHIEIEISPEIAALLQTLSLELNMDETEIVTKSLIYGAIAAFKE